MVPNKTKVMLQCPQTRENNTPTQKIYGQKNKKQGK